MVIHGARVAYTAISPEEFGSVAEVYDLGTLNDRPHRGSSIRICEKHQRIVVRHDLQGTLKLKTEDDIAWRRIRAERSG
jgi:hypothetical protein